MLKRSLLTLLATMALAAAALAGPMTDAGNRAMDRRDFEEAAQQYRRALAEGEGAVAAYRLGFALAQMRRYDEALRAFDEARRLDPTYGFTRGGRERFEEVYR
jgi:tetratricopeptide (TPR) repeat protein